MINTIEFSFKNDPIFTRYYGVGQSFIMVMNKKYIEVTVLERTKEGIKCKYEHLPYEFTYMENK